MTDWNRVDEIGRDTITFDPTRHLVPAEQVFVVPNPGDERISRFRVVLREPSPDVVPILLAKSRSNTTWHWTSVTARREGDAYVFDTGHLDLRSPRLVLVRLPQ